MPSNTSYILGTCVGSGDDGVRNCRRNSHLLQVMGELKTFAILTGHPDITVVELQGLSQLHEGGFQDSVAVESTSNFTR